MDRIHILILGRNDSDINPVMQSLNNIPEWEVHTFTDKEAAVSFFQYGPVDVVIFTEAVDTATSAGLRKLFHFQQEHVILLTAMGQDLRETVNEALYRNAGSGFRIIDNALLAAELPFNLN